MKVSLGDKLSPKLVTLVLEDDIFLISDSAEEQQKMLKELESESKKVDLKKNLSKTKVMADPN